MGKHKTTLVSCIVCNRDFEARNTDLKIGGGLYCSRSCKNTKSHNPNYKGGQLSNYEYKLRAMKKNPLRFKAMQAVQTAVRNGTLVRIACHCGELKTEAHHEDYNKPLDVEWLCRKHHIEKHHKNPAALIK